MVKKPLAVYLRKILGRRTLKSILRNLHMERNDQNDLMQKVRPIFKMFTANTRIICYPKKELCLDESLLSWWGRFGFRQNNQNKKQQFEI